MVSFNRRRAAFCAAVTMAALAACSQQDGQEETSNEAPSLLNTAERQEYFGDLHLHTSYSLDSAAAKTTPRPTMPMAT